MAAAAYESDDTGGGSSSDESADIDFHGIKHTVFKGNMAAVEKDIEELEKGTLKEYVEEVARAEAERDDYLRQAELYRAYRHECINAWLQQDIEEIAKQLDKEKEEVKGQMMDMLKERKRRLEEERNNNDLVEETKSSGWRKSVRGKRGDTDRKPNEKQDRATKRKKVQFPSGPRISIRLKDADVSEDVLLVATRAARGEKARAGGRR